LRVRSRQIRQLIARPDGRRLRQKALQIFEVINPSSYDRLIPAH
jgi:hypothetical protein